MNNTENIPQEWNDERDSQFFRITASLFPPAYCFGASVLLASYDLDDAFTGIGNTATPAATTRPATADIPARTCAA